jgi:hypothetical protein
MIAMMKLSMKKKLKKLKSILKIKSILSLVQNVLGIFPLVSIFPSIIVQSVSKLIPTVEKSKRVSENCDVPRVIKPPRIIMRRRKKCHRSSRPVNLHES